MTRFHFRFEKLLEIREYRKRSAEELFAATTREWREAVRRAEISAQLAQDALDSLKQPTVYSVWQVGEKQRYAKMLRERWEHDDHRAQVLRGRADEARRRLVQAMQEVQVLEKLRSRHYEAHRAQEEADQQKLFDELSTNSHIRNLQRSSGDYGRRDNGG